MICLCEGTLLGPRTDPVELMIPMPFECFNPVVNWPQLFVIDFIHATLALLTDRNKPHLSQYAQMFRDGRLRQPQRQDNRPDCQVPVLRQQLNNLPPSRLCDGIENVGGGGCSCHACSIFP